MNLRRSSQARVGRIRNLNSHRRMGLFGLSRYFESLEDRLALSAAPIQVTTTADVVDPNDGLTSLREAIEQANVAATPQTIVLAAGRYQLSSAAGELEISSSVTIAGADAMSTIVDGGGQVRVFHIDGSDATVSLSGLTIQGGNADGNGGGILDTATVSHLTLTGCMINGNAASGDGG
ncbi:MAG TPA: CSLREA domain-containing protein, partial [Pirellulales bacterium]|nr:CSLREA domain-containing protein [Pirellulales bacterium]